MSAAVMSNYYSSQLQVHNWMLAQMNNSSAAGSSGGAGGNAPGHLHHHQQQQQQQQPAGHHHHHHSHSASAAYPPPPQQQDTHYSALYPGQGGAQQLLDPAQQEQLQFSSLNQPIYPKVETLPGTGHNSPASQHIQSLAHDLQHHHGADDQPRHYLSHVSHQLQQPTPVTSHPTSAAGLSQPPTHTSPPEQPQKTNRLRKACDSCSIRKVKCDETGPPCRACAALDIPCTFDRPSRRRGPPNRHAEAIKRRRLEEQANASTPGSGISSPASPTHAAHALAALSGHSSAPLSAESICPIETLDLLIDDFFSYIHPLCPFPHEPSFREAWKRREDLTNKSFLALLASMTGALVASFPRKPRLHLKAQKRENMFPNHMSLVQRCQKVCAAARGPGYLESDNLNVYDAATSYFLALTGVYTFRWRLGRLYFGECLTILRTLGLHKAKAQTFTRLGALPTSVGSHSNRVDHGNEQNVDNITMEMGRRIFWTMFVSVRSMEQLGASFSELVIPPSTHSDPYPPLPAEVDDFCIYPTHTEQQPSGLVPTITGFNANVRIYRSYDMLATLEMAWGIDSIVDWDRQKRVLYDSLRRCKEALHNLPSELMVRTDVGTPYADDGGSSFYPAFAAQPHLGRDPAQSLMSPSSRTMMEQNAEERRRSQHEIQKANIYASSLATRSYLVEKYWNLCDVHQRSRQSPHSMPSSPAAAIVSAGIDNMVPHIAANHFEVIEREIHDERESIVKDLLVVLGSIDQVNMEPNADSFTMKIRSIASTLLETPDQRKGPLAMQAQEYLSAFLKILMKLERTSPANSDVDGSCSNLADEEDVELRAWADLREYQLKFAQQGGLLGLS